MSAASEKKYATGVVLFLFSALLFSTPSTLHAAEPDAQDPPPDSTAAPFDFSNEGIFGCNQVAGASASAGAMAAIGGVYVPVNDAAVTLNTGILVYKECVLRPLQDRLREAAMAALLRKNVVGVQTGREGNPQYVVNQGDERAARSNKVALTFLTDGTLNSMNPALQRAVQRDLAANHQAQMNTNKDLECSYQGDWSAAATNPTGQQTTLSNIESLAEPTCNRFFAYVTAREEMNARIARSLYELENELNWGRGFRAVTDNSSNPLLEKVLTPASVVQESFQLVLGSPVRQLESANDIGQIIGALFSGVTTQALTDSRGLAGLTQSNAGRPSYLDQVTRESSQGVIGAAVNAALTILNAARQTEASFLAAMNAIASSLTQTINQLRQTERQCWALVVPRVEAYASENSIELDPAKIRAATSSLAFAQQVIDSQITPLANVALTNVQSSQRALGLIDQLIQGVTNTTSISAQRLALQQLDTLVAQRALHTQFDVNRANQQRDDVASTMATLITDTAKAWGDSPDASIGWCNINNPSVIQQWADRWKK